MKLITVFALSFLAILSYEISFAASIPYKPYALKEFLPILEKDYSFTEESSFVRDEKYQETVTNIPLEYTVELNKFDGIQVYLRENLRARSAILHFNLDPKINWVEFLSRLNQSQQLLAKLVSCSSKETYKEYYFKYDFSNCPDLKVSIDTFRRDLASFLVNSQFTSFSEREVYSYTVSDIFNYYFREEILRAPRIISAQDIEFKEIANKNKKRVSSFFRENADVDLPKLDINPLMLQVLIELSTLTVVGENSEGIYVPGFSIYLKQSKFTANIFSFPKFYDLTAFYDKEINPDAENYFPGIRPSRLENFEKKYRKAIQKRGRNSRAEAIREQDSQNQLSYGDTRYYSGYSGPKRPPTLFSQDFKEVTRVGIFSLRLLAELSLVLKKDDFGFLPSTYHDYFAFLAVDNRYYSFYSDRNSHKPHMPSINDELPVPSLAKWIAGISGEHNFKSRFNGYCKSVTFVWSCDGYPEVLSILIRLRFYVEKSFPDIRNIEENLL
ncbi:MAG: hypothetical protein VX642_01370 [Bdellovibrionota bacterium]|nr:hypothetical protein [Bdellovibrionota bacterium]